MECYVYEGKYFVCVFMMKEKKKRKEGVKVNNKGWRKNNEKIKKHIQSFVYVCMYVCKR